METIQILLLSAFRSQLWLLALVQYGLLIILAPLLPWSLQRLRLILQGLEGPSWRQPYRDLAKLLGKQPITSQQTPSLQQLGPLVGLSALLVAAAILPLLGLDTLGSLAHFDDLYLLLGLLLLARFVWCLSALDSPSAFTGLGAARAMMVHVVAEPVFLLALLALGMEAGTTGWRGILVHVGDAKSGLSVLPAHFALLLALLLATMLECGRLPYGNPLTHLELGMIERAAASERAGPDLAFSEYSEALRLTLLMLLTSNLLVRTLCDLTRTYVSSPWVWLLNLGLLPLLLLATSALELAQPRLRLGELPRVGLVLQGLVMFAIFYSAVLRG